MTKVNEGRPGYKETKLGWIPEEWEIKNLIDLSINGINNGVFNDPDKVGSGYRLINVLDLYSEPFIDTNALSKLALSNNEFIKNQVKWGDLFFTRSSLKMEGIAHCNINLDDSKDISYDGHIMKISPNHKVCYPPYLRSYCIANTARNFFLSRAKLNTMTTIGQNDIKDLPIPLPPLPEQKKIAEILSTWDEAIEKLEKLIDLKEKRKKGLMNDLFTGKRRLSGFGYPKNSNNTIPDGWKKIKLKDIAIDITRKNNGESTHVLTASGTNGLVDQKEYFNRNVSGADLTNYYLLKRNEFAYNRSSMKGYPFGAIKILDKYDAGVLSTLYICFSIDESNVDLTYIDEYFESGICNIELNGRVQVGARAHGLLNIAKSDFYGINLVIPPLKEQQEIVNIIKTFRADLNYLKKTLDNIKTQKRGLMQKLLTGEIRVKV